MVFPAHCLGCGQTGRDLCPDCAAGLVPAPSLPPPPGVDRFVAVFAYEGVGRDIIVNLKYRNARRSLAAVATPLARLLAPAVTASPVRPVVTWAPTTAARRRTRGFDQAQLLARAVGATLGLPAARLLTRRSGAPQTGASRSERLARPDLVARPPVPRSVLLIDDVRTSGATLTAAAGALRARGAEWLIVGTLAQTPLNRALQQAENGN